jgi:MFS family permease
MLGLEAVPAVLYFFGLFFVPRSPRWLLMKGKSEEAVNVLSRFTDSDSAQREISNISNSIEQDEKKDQAGIGELFKPAMKLVLTIGVVIAILQQITGINSVFFYAPMIFEQSGIGEDASFVQAILVGIVNLVFTVLAILFIDKLGRKPLLIIGVAGIAISMFVLAKGFDDATYSFTEESIATLPEEVDRNSMQSFVGVTFDTELELKDALIAKVGEETYKTYKTEFITASVHMNSMLILVAILSFVASFAISIGPVMWVLFSELFPNKIRGIAISFVGLINSIVSSIVQWVFPWELDTLGSATTFMIYGVFAALGLIFIIRVIPETKGKSLEELEAQLVK